MDNSTEKLSCRKQVSTFRERVSIKKHCCRSNGATIGSNRRTCGWSAPGQEIGHSYDFYTWTNLLLKNTRSATHVRALTCIMTCRWIWLASNVVTAAYTEIWESAPNKPCGTEYQQPYRRCNSQTPYEYHKWNIAQANERVWSFTQLVKLSFNHPPVVLTADVFHFL